ncbi:MAG TPA: helix-hairpin-helix domain-containing protein [Candidatus Saccharimonadales bacterium]|nr:helix-hairpin-helix domain-containing protein [Candidatus Saccharimonadales bacterium]
MFGDIFERITLFLQANIWILLIAVALCSGGVTYAVSKSSQIPTIEKPIEVNSTSEASATSIDSSTIKVDVSGAVKSPGVYSLPQDARINDALVISGGALTSVSAQWLAQHVDLAQKLKDTQKVYVPFDWEVSDVCRQDELKKLDITSTANLVIPIPTTVNPTGTTHTSPTPAQTQNELTHVNSATQEELQSLPGIGPVYSQKIIDNRPFASASDLVSKAKLSQSLVDKISPLIDFE